ncbi:hypothetical protein [Edaphobacter modestus]|uniref:Uncharacterized protein n=1 Tax=Edaphobacter modestus TaxID=388466 RepID=A0A4Q7YR89_9BACT|nr:hypothetical protein [Edaphobacter modestus]RZU39423.1 hypothetical protein BDD14_0806 [Edaphobacter modestus]
MNTTQTLTAGRWVDKTADRWFYAGMAVVFILISIASFAPSIVNPENRLGPLTWLVAAHGIVFFAWLLIFLVQSLLIQTGRVAIHRRLGTASMFLAAGIVVLGYVTTIVMARRGFDLSGDLGAKSNPLGIAGQTIFPLGNLFEFGILVAAGYWYRRQSDIHKRLMLFAIVVLMPAPFAHFIGHSPLLRTHPAAAILPIALSLAASGIYDLIRFRRIHPVSLWVGIALFAIGNLSAFVIGPSAAWRRFAEWLIS